MYKTIKSILDILIVFLILVLLSPLLVLTIVILVFTGEHEVFYFQERIGYKNKPFIIWKFASMLKNSPNTGTAEITLRNDPRVTKFGRILRITKINELPQIINVIKGDMSIVGPRPLMNVSFKSYPDNIQQVIYNCKPGMTGIGSLIFRDEEKIVSEASDAKAMYITINSFKGELELWYQKNISFYTDYMIIFLTGWAILFPKNKLAYKLLKDLPVRPF